MENQPTNSRNSTSDPIKLPSSYIAYLALLISLLVAVGLIFSYWQFTHRLSWLKQKSNYIQEQIETTDQRIQQNLDNVLRQHSNLETALNNLQEMSKGNIAIWRFAEAKYLVQLAYYHLTFTRDVPAALALLQTAEQRIASINDPALLPIRQLIANNIAALQAVPKVDLAALLTRITALQMQVTKLPTVGLPQPKNEEEQPENAKSLSPLHKAINDSWTTLQKIVIIRNQDQLIHPLLSPEQQAYLQQNLQLILQQAQWAALRGQGAVYQSSLDQAKKWIENYFARNLPATQAFLQAISDLQKVNVQPDLPDLAPIARKIQQVAYIQNKSSQAA